MSIINSLFNYRNNKIDFKGTVYVILSDLRNVTL